MCAGQSWSAQTLHAFLPVTLLDLRPVRGDERVALSAPPERKRFGRDDATREVDVHLAAFRSLEKRVVRRGHPVDPRYQVPLGSTVRAPRTREHEQLFIAHPKHSLIVHTTRQSQCPERVDGGPAPRQSLGGGAQWRPRDGRAMELDSSEARREEEDADQQLWGWR